MEQKTIDVTANVTAILNEIAAELAEAEQREREAQARVQYLRGQRDGVLAVVRASQRPVVTHGENKAPGEWKAPGG